MKRTKLNINRLLRRLRGNRKHKDRLFQKVFERKEDLLALYNAVNHTSYTNAEELEITTLDDVIYLSMKNDLSFIISATLNLYEHQSTFNANMPIRGLLYFARLYEAYIKKNKLDIYGHKMIDLPEPRYIVFYNGRSNQPDEKELKLSDSFHSDNPNPVLECRARMININLGHNQELMEGCKRLWDYSYFIAEVNQNLYLLAQYTDIFWLSYKKSGYRYPSAWLVELPVSTQNSQRSYARNDSLHIHRVLLPVLLP